MGATKQQTIDCYIQTLAKVVGSCCYQLWPRQKAILEASSMCSELCHEETAPNK
ncbi:hypothetical protein QQ045_010883 [Rhodiola kirilowii]